MQELQNRSRIAWIDAARGLSMLMVLWFHAEMYSGMGQKFSIFVTPFFMQVFFFLSGYLFIADKKVFSFRKKCKNALYRLWLPYLYFTFLMMLPKMWLHHRSIWQGFRDILTGYASWFVYTLGIVQFIIGAGYCISKKNDMALWIISLAGLFAGWCVDKIGLPVWFGMLGYVFRMIPFFAMGVIFQHNEPWLKKQGFLFFWYCLAIYISLFILDQFLFSCPRNGAYYGCKNYWSYTLCGFAGTVALYAGIRYWDGWIWLRFIGRNSLVFYFLNGMIYTVIIKILERYGLPSIILVPVMLIMEVGILSMASLTINRYIPWMTGMKIHSRSIIS